MKTLLDLVLVILMHRNRNSGLLLSELGDHLLGGEHGPAGVKRIAEFASLSSLAQQPDCEVLMGVRE